MIICCISLVVFLALINQGEARAADEQYELAYRQHLADGHIELSDFAKALTHGVMRENNATAELRAQLLKYIMNLEDIY